MKKVTLGALMVNAIRQFEKENKNYEIINVYACEFGGDTALFNIEYVDKNGEYHELQIDVRN